MTGACLRIQDGVLLTGRPLEVALFAVEVAQRSRARNGLPPMQSLEALRVAMSPRGHADGAEGVGGQAGDQDEEMVSTQVAAQLLGCSNRQARRLAPLLGGRLVGGRWLVDRQAVNEHNAGGHAG